MHHANDWFDSWQAECYKTPDSLNMDAYLKLYRKCEDWARKKRLDADAQAVNQEIGGVDRGGEGGGEDEGYYDDDGNWWDWQGNCWPTEGGEEQGGADEVTKGRGKGYGPQCYRCWGYGHLARNCPNPRQL